MCEPHGRYQRMSCFFSLLSSLFFFCEKGRRPNNNKHFYFQFVFFAINSMTCISRSRNASDFGKKIEKSNGKTIATYIYLCIRRLCSEKGKNGKVKKCNHQVNWTNFLGWTRQGENKMKSNNKCEVEIRTRNECAMRKMNNS